MELAEVLALYELLADHGIEVWIDGGWGIDALLGEQTRPHNDLDIAVRHDDVAELRIIMSARGYDPIERDDTEPWMFVVGDKHGNEVDVHSFTIDRQGHNIYGIAYPADSLTGEGHLDGRMVRCISAEWAVTFHTAYARRDPWTGTTSSFSTSGSMSTCQTSSSRDPCQCGSHGAATQYQVSGDSRISSASTSVLARV